VRLVYTLQVGTPLVMMPNATRCKVVMVWRDDEEVQAAGPGENLRIRLSGIDEDQVPLPSPLYCTFHLALFSHPLCRVFVDAFLLSWWESVDQFALFLMHVVLHGGVKMGCCR
jgi:hypothetical protein